MLLFGFMTILGAIVANGLVMARMNGCDDDERWDGTTSEVVHFGLSRES